mmetsp:Transcript_79051/g.256372  ORF Transcript_79051/g.256372 Transcript_79051/m.256372 type:complete len:399 (+) Transcript_79051:59-1255(+)
MAPKSIALGTDCSGMETPVMALKNLGVDVNHVFACDVNVYAKKTIMANFPPKQWYDDLTKRDNTTAPKTDLYVAGFPCQPFSSAGKQQGFADERGRGTVFWSIRDYIDCKQPKVFILENVVGLTTIQGGQYYKDIKQSLEDLGTYNLYDKILNTKDHGVPQNRKRIYFIGIKKTVDKGDFSWPEPLPQVSIEKFLKPRKGKVDATCLPPKSAGTAYRNVKAVYKMLLAAGHNPYTEPWIVDIDSSEDRMKFMYDVTPCLTCSRAQGHWVTNRGRRLTKVEQMRLQAIRTPAEGFKVVVSDSQLGRQIGNAMSVNILERLLVRILPAAGLALAGSLKDRWAKPASSASFVSSSSAPADSKTSGSKRKAAGDPKEVTQKARNATRSLRAAHAKKMQLARA